MKNFFIVLFCVFISIGVAVSSGILMYNYSYDAPEEIVIETKENYDEYEIIYNTRLNKLKFYSIGDIVTEQELSSLSYNEGKYAIWFDVCKKNGNNCLYEVKGLCNEEETEYGSPIDWRFYIETENNIIISIRRG